MAPSDPPRAQSAPSGASVRRTLTRNAAFNAMGRAWDALAGVLMVVLTPYIVSKVGMTQWGIWSIVGALTSYASLLDIGLAGGFGKFIAEHAARGETDEQSAVVSTGLAYYLVFAVAFIAVAWPAVDGVVALAARLDPNRFGDLANPALLADVRFLFRWGLALFAGACCITAFTSVQTGLQCFGVTNILGAVSSLVRLVALVAFLRAGCGVRGLLYANAAVLGVFAIGSVAAAFRLAPYLKVGPRHVRWATFRRLFGFGWQTQVSRFADLVMFQTDRLVIMAVYRSFELAGLYRLGEDLAMKMRQVPQFLLVGLVPAVSDLDARGDLERVRHLYLRATKYVAVVTVPLAAFTIGAAGPIMRTWMGEGFEDSAWVLRILAAGVVANLVPGPGVSVALGRGRPDIQMKAGLIATVANIALTVGLVLTIGFWGIPIGTAISMLLSWAWFSRAMKPIADVGPALLARVALWWPAAASVPGFTLCVLGDWCSASWPGRIENGLMLMASAALFGVAYLVAIRLAPFLDTFDIEFLENTLRLKRIPGARWWCAWGRQQTPQR